MWRLCIVAHADWGAALRGAFIPHLHWIRRVAHDGAGRPCCGTTISPYLFFWQSSQEVEELATEARQAALRRAARGRARTAAHSYRYAGRHALFEHRRAVHHLGDGGARSHTHGITDIDDERAGRPGVDADRGTIRHDRVCARHYRHGTAGAAGAGRLGVLCACARPFAGTQVWTGSRGRRAPSTA